MNPATALGLVFVDELSRCGVTEAVLSPGSWSTPLALAFRDHPSIRLHVRIDERSAAYVALGLAKASGQPVPVLCTSGTAAANLHPAVLEADQSGIPLVVLTADRPPELRNIGANQTTDQIKLYGAAVRFFTEVGVAEARVGPVGYWRSLVCQAVARAVDPMSSGPVHLNLAFRKPFVPDGVDDWPEPLVGRTGRAPWVQVSPRVPTPVSLAAPARGVLIIGDVGGSDADGQVARALAFARRAGWPVLAEPSSNARCDSRAISSYRCLLSNPSFVDRHVPDVVVTVGKFGLAPATDVDAFLARAGRHVMVAPSEQWVDPARTAAEVVPALGEPLSVDPDPAWLSSWREADAVVCAAIDAMLDADADITEPLSEPRLARDLPAMLPDGALLFIGPSMPIRDVEMMMRPRSGLRILANRGLNGIDGVVSTAVGAALAHQAAGGGPAYALVGDLTLLHDHNGLVLGPDEPCPDLTMVVVNNDGGGMFSLLPQAVTDDREGFERVYGTPHGVRLEQLAASVGAPYALVKTVSDLDSALSSDHYATSKLRLIEVRTNRAANAALHGYLSRKIAKVLQELVF